MNGYFSICICLFFYEEVWKRVFMVFTLEAYPTLSAAPGRRGATLPHPAGMPAVSTISRGEP